MTCIDCGREGRVYGAGRCRECGDNHWLKMRALHSEANKERSDRAAAKRDHPAGKRRHIRLLACECHSPSRMCPLHEPDPFWEALA